MTSACPLVVALMVIDVKVEAESISIQRHGPLEIRNLKHHRNKTVLARHRASLVPARGDPHAASGISIHRVSSVWVVQGRSGLRRRRQSQKSCWSADTTRAPSG